jgi:hypothetical protein
MKVLPPFRLNPEPLNQEAEQAQGFRWAPDGVGRRHRLGGEPDFLQQPEWPSCPSCRKQISFYRQLDSIGDTIAIADCGMIYTFISLECFESRLLVQSG